MSYYHECVSLYDQEDKKTNDNKLKISEMNNKIGSVYYNLGDYTEALVYYERCL